MVAYDDLKRIYLLRDLEQPMLGRLLPYAQVHLFGERATIFDEGQKAENFYMLLKGKVVLEVSISKAVNISLGSIKPGYSFGWSALFPGSSYTSSAICVESCEVISIGGETFASLLRENHSMGYSVMEGVVKILKSRLQRRTNQFLEALRTHPEIERLL